MYPNHEMYQYCTDCKYITNSSNNYVNGVNCVIVYTSTVYSVRIRIYVNIFYTRTIKVNIKTILMSHAFGAAQRC